MTHDSTQLLVSNDEAVHVWLLDRFGIDVSRIYVGDSGLKFEMSRSKALTMTVEFFVGADDLRAFPDPSALPPHRDAVVADE